MTIAFSLRRQRRMLAICAASLLLHALVIGWAGAQLGPEVQAGQPDAAPTPVVATLLPPAPRPAPRKPAQPPARAAQKPAPPQQRPSAPVTHTAPEPLASLEQAPVDAVALPQPELDADTLALGDIALAAPPEAPPETAAPRYRVDLPPSASLSFDVTRKEANGSEWKGSSEMQWQRAGESYRLNMNAFVNMLVRVNVGSVTSEGALTEDGIAPRRVLEKRMGRSQTATHFKTDEGRITFSSREHSVPMLPGAQDKATVQFQLAGIARADSAQLAAGVEIQVGSERDAAPYRFTLVGEEDIDTPLGRIATWHLARPPRPGSYNARLDIWLAPQYGWLPVKVRNLESSGAETTQTIRNLLTEPAP